MLCRSGEPFDSDDHLFEIKWDGTRALAFVEGGDHRLVNRRAASIGDRYPELAFLAGLPVGTILDGEVVVLDAEGRSDFPSLLSREQAAGDLRVRNLARSLPATYVVFDLLAADFEPLLERPLSERRDRLAAIVADAGQGRLVLSEGIVGAGRLLFDEACQRRLEGVVAKRLCDRYQPGKRSDSWIKIKPRHELACVVIGFVQDESGSRDFRSLIIATPAEDGSLACVGRVGSGIGEAERESLNEFLWSHLRPEPLVASDEKGLWVEPGLYCRVSYLERTASGSLRGPVFEGVIDG